MAWVSLCAARIPKPIQRPTSRPPSSFQSQSQSQSQSLVGVGAGGSHHLKLVPVPSLPLSFRFKNAMTLQARQLITVFASNLNSSGGDSPKEISDGTEVNDASPGPPFLTILAAFVVLFLLLWILGSIVMGLIHSINRLLSAK